LAILLFKVQEKTELFQERSSLFFENLSLMIESQPQPIFAELQQPCEALIFKLSDFIRTREIRERNTQDTDYLLRGRMLILRALLQKFPRYKLDVGKMITYHLLHDCLFQVP